MGYNGANNTGAEALLMADIEDIRTVFPKAVITVPAINEANLRRYITEGPNLRIVHLPTIFFFTLRKLVRENDLIMLVEGSTYMDTWGSALLWAFLWTTKCAHDEGKKCLVYAVDAGELSKLNQRLVRREASKTDLIITRSQAAADRLRSYGVTAAIQATADNAFNFKPSLTDAGWLKEAWPEADSGIVGIAAVNFHLWPVVVRLWERKENCYKWPYYYSNSPERRQAAESLADGYANLVDKVVEEYGKSVALICMEQLDEPIAKMIQNRVKNSSRTRIFSSRKYNASQMTALLRSLDLLVTSRYHACVLSLSAQIPQVAVGHDLRLNTIYEELGMKDGFFINPDQPGMFKIVESCIDKLMANPTMIKNALTHGYEEHLTKARLNRALLHEFALANELQEVNQNAGVLDWGNRIPRNSDHSSAY